MTTRHLPGSSDAARHGTGDADLTIMLAAHAAFRRDLAQLARAASFADLPAPGRRASVQAGWELFKRQLHLHHTAEDAIVWPALRERLAHSEHAQSGAVGGDLDRPVGGGGQSGGLKAVSELSGRRHVHVEPVGQVADVGVDRGGVAEDAEPLQGEVVLAGGARLRHLLHQHPAQDRLGLADGLADRLSGGDRGLRGAGV